MGHAHQKLNLVKVYTKGGDKGQTSLLSGKRLPKHHLRIETYGTVDELNAFTGLLLDSSNKKVPYDTLHQIQVSLLNLGANLAMDEHNEQIKLPEVGDSDVLFLEQEIDAMDAQLPPLEYFILPGGHVLLSYCHVCRTVCRRAERMLVKLSETDKVLEQHIVYLNRLSDYFFVLARKLALDLNINEIHWKPNL